MEIFKAGMEMRVLRRDFLQYASQYWKTPPQFVLLAEDASFDLKNYLGFGDWDIVPTRLIDTSSMETASDDWLADFDGDGITKLAIGRLPVRSKGESASMVDKILAYEPSSAVGLKVPLLEPPGLPSNPNIVLLINASNGAYRFCCGVTTFTRNRTNFVSGLHLDASTQRSRIADCWRKSIMPRSEEQHHCNHRQEVFGARFLTATLETILVTAHERWFPCGAVI